MTLADIQNLIYRRTGTSVASFSDANLLIAINIAYNRVNSLIRKWVDNYRPTAFTSAQLTAGTAEPVFDAEFHDLIPLWVIYNYDVDNGKPGANGILQELKWKEDKLAEFYGGRNYHVVTVTIAAPGVFKKEKHGLQTGDRISLITTGALPTGLAVDTFYYVVWVDDEEFEVSATEDGTAITTSGSQSGTHYYFDEKTRKMEARYENTR